MTTPAICVRDLHKSFSGIPVLKGASLEVAHGETIAIIGGSGCGKSVLLKHIIGLLIPDRGHVEVLGHELARISTRQLDVVRQNISMVFQSSALLGSLSVAENVGIGLIEGRRMPRGKVREIVEEKLALVGLENRGQERPENLSGGMRKRVALARALAMDPEIILYDEPTSELDPITAATIDNLILDMKNRFHKTSIVVTHDMVHALSIADRICMLHEGQMVFEGSPQELLSEKSPTVAQFVRRDGTALNIPAM